jgi:hypothetical protein
MGELSYLPEGSYLAMIDLYDGTDNKAAVWTEAVHIHGGFSTTLEHSFTTANFTGCPPALGGTENTLAAKLDAALESPSGVYTIVVDGTETDLGAFAPKTLTLTGGKDITIIIRGNGSEVQLGGEGSLFTLSPSGSTLTLVLQDIRLRGKSGNSASLVQINSRGTLEMKAGALITGNTNSSSDSSSYGGGVYVNGGTFSMSGGAVSGNSSSSTTTSSYGSGVYVAGTFEMSGGAVSGNSSSYRSFGGGVYVDSSGTFEMSGSEVSGNKVSSSSYTSSNGGGVYVGSGGTFSMNDGEVSGNTVSYTTPTSSSNGGGVYVVNGTFTMNGGAVKENFLSSTNGYGKEVLVRGTFKMSGNAQPERIFLYYNTDQCIITITGNLSGYPAVPIDLGVTSSSPLTSWVGKQILKLDDSYPLGDLSILKTYFDLENYKEISSPYTEMPIPTSYVIDNEGKIKTE